MKEIRNIVILTGAGVSAESGIPVFRSETGLWENHRIEDVCVPSAWTRDRQLVRTFYDTMRSGLKTRNPNPAHFAIARLEREWTKGAVTLITQNIDDLHEKAGSTRALHMHGALRASRCYEEIGGCGHVIEPWDDDIKESDVCPSCGRKGLMRPHIVWFEEMPLYMNEISDALSACDLFISIGTSGVVYPAAGFVRTAKRAGASAIEFNLNPSSTNSLFDAGIYGKAGETLPEFVDGLLEEGSAYIENVINS